MSDQNLDIKENRLKSFFITNQKKIFLFILIAITIFLGIFAYNYYKDVQNTKVSDKFNSVLVKISKNEKIQIQDQLIEIIKEKNKFYSPMALNLIIEKNIEIKDEEIINLFNIVLTISDLDKSDKDLFKIKKALFLSKENQNEEKILKLLKPIINSESVWRVKALTILEKYYLTNNEKKKAKEFSDLLKK